MIEFTSGDMLKSNADALVNTVNCVGVMGRGIAVQFKDAFQENFKAYVAACKRGDVQPGRMFVFETGKLTPPRYVINFPSKRHWRGKSRMEDIESGRMSRAGFEGPEERFLLSKDARKVWDRAADVTRRTPSGSTSGDEGIALFSWGACHAPAWSSGGEIAHRLAHDGRGDSAH